MREKQMGKWGGREYRSAFRAINRFGEGRAVETLGGWVYV